MRSWAAFLLISVLGIPVFITSVRAAEPVTVTGQVLDPEGQPVPNAELRLMYASGPPNWWEALTGRADEHGRFTLKYQPGEEHQDKMFQVAALAAGYGIGVASGLPASPDVTLHLTKPASISGIVTGAAGQAVQGARVSVLSLSYYRVGRRVGAFLVVVACRPQAETDAEGRFRIDQLPTGAECGVMVEAEGYPYARVKVTAPQQDVKIALVRGARILGRVLDNGEPVVGVQVFAQPAGHQDGSGAAVSDQHGNYELRDLAPGPYNVMLDPPEGLTAAAHEKVEVKSGETLQELNFQLIEGGLVTGSVRDADTGEPISEAGIGAYGPARPSSSAAIQSVETDEGGRYEFRLPPGENRLYVSGTPKGYSWRDVQPRHHLVPVAEGQIIGSIDFALRREPLLRGRITGPDGQSLARAKLWYLGSAMPWAHADDEGRFEVLLGGRFADGEPVLITSADERLAGAFWIEREGQTMEFHLQPVASVVAWILDTELQPIEGVPVGCHVVQPENRYLSGIPVCASVADAEGRLQFPNIPASAELALYTDTKGFEVAREWPKTFMLAPGETRDIGVLTMNPAGRTVSGLVQDADTDAPASNALVVDLSTGREAVTDDRGRFELTRLRPDRPALLLVRDRSQRLYALRKLDPDEQQPVNLVLKPLASVEGYVVDPQWRPVGGARVVAEIQGRGYYGVRTEGREYLPGLPEARTDGRGHYRLDNLLDGMSYEIRAEADGRMGAQELTAEGGSQMVVPDLVIWPPPQPPD